MKRVFLLIMLSLFMVVGNVAGADLDGCWFGSMYCSVGADDVDATVEIEQTGDFFTVVSENEFCSGVIDGNKFYMSCDGDGDKSSFAHGEIKGKTIYVISHVPADGKACKGVYQRVDCPVPPE